MEKEYLYENELKEVKKLMSNFSDSTGISYEEEKCILLVPNKYKCGFMGSIRYLLKVEDNSFEASNRIGEILRNKIKNRNEYKYLSNDDYITMSTIAYKDDIIKVIFIIKNSASKYSIDEYETIYNNLIELKKYHMSSFSEDLMSFILNFKDSGTFTLVYKDNILTSISSVFDRITNTGYSYLDDLINKYNHIIPYVKDNIERPIVKSLNIPSLSGANFECEQVDWTGNNLSSDIQSYLYIPVTINK